MSDLTIYALSTGAAPTGVAIIRISGPGARQILTALCGFVPEPRQAKLCKLRHPETGAILDEALVLFFNGPHSFTGEDVAEFHVHGGRAVIEAVLSTLSQFDNCRMAERGEFSRRGFFNGKLDLLEIEGLADLIAAYTEAQRSQALAQMGGAFSGVYDKWRSDLIYAIALVESALDFSDEGDVPEEIAKGAIPYVAALRDVISTHLDDGRRGEILRDGYRVVIAGPPNAGKSRLLNALARRDAAIVSEEAGTTRDVIEVRLDIEGLPIIVTDTAGIREAQSSVEAEGIRRSFEQVERGELVLWLIDGSAPSTNVAPEILNSRVLVFTVWNKADLMPVPNNISVRPDFEISAETGLGIGELVGAIGKAALNRISQGEGATITRARHRELLMDSLSDFEAFLSGDMSGTELRAEDLRRAAFSIGRLTGKVDVEDVLDKIFAEFCIGK